MPILSCNTCHGLYPSSEDKHENIQGRRCTCDPDKRPQYFRGAAFPVVDLDTLDWEAIKLAACESKWMPPEYTKNDWVSDVCAFLRDGPKT